MTRIRLRATRASRRLDISSGVLYRINGPAYDLYQINPINAVLTKVGPSLSRPSGFAFTALPSPIGDFNHDGAVDAADYIVWRTIDGKTNKLPNDNGIGGTIGQAHYHLWRAQFGQTAGGGAQSNTLAPEPASALLLIWR